MEDIPGISTGLPYAGGRPIKERTNPQEIIPPYTVLSLFADGAFCTLFTDFLNTFQTLLKSMFKYDKITIEYPYERLSKLKLSY